MLRIKEQIKVKSCAKLWHLLIRLWCKHTTWSGCRYFCSFFFLLSSPQASLFFFLSFLASLEQRSSNLPVLQIKSSAENNSRRLPSASMLNLCEFALTSLPATSNEENFFTLCGQNHLLPIHMSDFLHLLCLALFFPLDAYFALVYLQRKFC